MEVTDGVAHSLTPKHYQRRNSALTFDQKAALTHRIDSGARPKQMMEADTLAAIAAKPEVDKLPGGGIEGVLAATRT